MEKFLYRYVSYIEDSKKKIVDFALNDFNISIVNNYLKVMPIIGKISLNLNIPLPDAKKGDLCCGIKMILDINLYYFCH